MRRLPFKTVFTNYHPYHCPCVIHLVRKHLLSTYYVLCNALYSGEEQKKKLNNTHSLPSRSCQIKFFGFFCFFLINGIESYEGDGVPGKALVREDFLEEVTWVLWEKEIWSQRKRQHFLKFLDCEKELRFYLKSNEKHWKALNKRVARSNLLFEKDHSGYCIQQGWQTCSVKEQLGNILSLVGQILIVATTQLRCCKAKATTDNTYTRVWVWVCSNKSFLFMDTDIWISYNCHISRNIILLLTFSSI